MIDYSAVEAGLAAWVKAHSSLTMAVWENEPRPFADRAFAVLSWVSATSQGIPDASYAEKPGAPSGAHWAETTTDHQVLVLQVGAESFQQTSSPLSARQAIEELRVRAHSARAAEALAAMGLALASVGTATRADYPVDQRMIQRWVLELRLNAVSSFADLDGAGSTIESTELVPTNVRDPADVPIHSALVPSEVVPPLP